MNQINGNTARAAVVESLDAGRFTIETVVLDELWPHEVRVDVRASSLCRSDWNFVERDYGHSFPALLGHEFAGVVEAVGDGVTHVRPGDHVVACLVASCGVCDKCIAGDRVWCVRPEVANRPPGADPRVSVHGAAGWQLYGLGGFSDTAIVHESQLVTIDSAVPFDRAALLGCAVVTGMGSVMRVAGVASGQTVAVVGAGGVGLNAVQAAALTGARKIFAIDLADDKLKLAKQFGATHLINAGSVDAVAAVKEATGGHGADHVFEMTGGSVPLQQGYQMTARGGAVYIVGMQKPGTSFAIPAEDLGRGVAVRTVKMGGTNFKLDIPYYAELYLQGRLNLDDLITKRIDLAEINEGYESLVNGSALGRTIIEFTSNQQEGA